MTDRARVKAVLARLRQAREACEFSQTDAGKRIGYAGPTVSLIERGQMHLTVETLLDMCDVYGCDPAWVLTGIHSGYDARAVLHLLDEYHAQTGRLLDELTCMEGPVVRVVNRKDRT